MYTRQAMSNLKFRLGFLILLSLLCQGLYSQRGFVHAAGPDLVDGSGKPLMLRGITLGNWFEPEGYMFHFNDGPQPPREVDDLPRELTTPPTAAAFYAHFTKPPLT